MVVGDAERRLPPARQPLILRRLRCFWPHCIVGELTNYEVNCGVSPQFKKLGRYAMAEYAILRVKKLKSEVAILGSMRHTFREQPTLNADPEKLASNTLIAAKSTADGMQEFRRRLPEKVRKNAVLALEYLITASPEVMAEKNRSEQDRYLHDSLDWLREKHGADNVFCAAVHRDETTPHLVAYVMPKDESGKLNCRKFLGERGALREMQSDFADRVGKQHGLNRGIQGSKAKHERVSRFYGLITKEAPESDSKTLFGNVKPEAYAEVKNALGAFVAREKAIKQRESKLEDLSSRLKEAEDKARELGIYTRSMERQFDQMVLRNKKVLEENQALEKIRRELISERDHYRDLLSEKSGKNKLENKGLDYDR